jgi:hypothetical protein
MFTEFRWIFKESSLFGDLSLNKRIILRWISGNGGARKEQCVVDRFNLTADGDQYQAHVNTVMNISVS